MSRDTFLKAARGQNDSGQAVYGTGTSIVCQDLMNELDAHFPTAHRDPETMAKLAMAGHTELGLDVVMPLFSVCHEAAGMGCDVNWGSDDIMPESGPPIFTTVDDVRIPDDLIDQPGCQVPIKAISLLRERVGDDCAVCGKIFGSWTQSYHYFGIENFLMMTIDRPDEVHRIMDLLLPVAIEFGKAQLDAGADCLLLADHATRDLCSPEAYEEFVAPTHKRMAEEFEDPLILHICGNTEDRIGMIAQTGLDCFHWDTNTGSATDVRELAGENLALMGGISNITLLAGTPEEIRAQSDAASAAGIDIVGPECAIPLNTPLANLKAVTGK